MRFADLLSVADAVGTGCFFVGLGFAIAGAVLKITVRVLT